MGQWRLGPSPWPLLPLPHVPRWPWVASTVPCLLGGQEGGGRSVRVQAHVASGIWPHLCLCAWECASFPAPTGGLGQDYECSAHAKRHSLRVTDGPPGGELEPKWEGTRRLPHVN
eukprot:scaffold31574_cov33-Tisochrysis_lutea.AAC.2